MREDGLRSSRVRRRGCTDRARDARKRQERHVVVPRRGGEPMTVVTWRQSRSDFLRSREAIKNPKTTFTS